MAFGQFLCKSLIALCCLNFVATQKHQDATKLKECYLKDKTQMNNCLKEFFVSVLPKFKTGIPEVKAPILDPLFLDLVEYKDQGVAIQANIKFINVTTIGASNAVPVSTTVDAKGHTFTLFATMAYLNCSGNYTMKGNLLVLPVDSNGTFTLNMTGLNMTFKASTVLSGTSVQVNKVAVDYTLTKLFLKFHNLLGGDTVGDAINNLISDNSDQIFNDLKPLIAGELEEAFQKFLLNLFDGVPPEAFIN